MMRATICWALAASLSTAQDGPFTWNDNFVPDFEGGVSDVAAADLDGDGRVDFVFAGRPKWNEETRIGVWLGAGPGDYVAVSPAPLIEVATGFVVGDFTGDGVPDVAAGAGGVTQLAVGRGDGTFDPPQVVAPWAGRLSTADVDGDGALDVLVQHVVTHSVTELVVLLQRFGSLSALQPQPLGDAKGLVTIDVDADGDLDLVAAGPSALTTYRNLGGGSFLAIISQPLTGMPTGESPTFDLAAAPLDGDGTDDLVLVTGDDDQGDIAVYSGNGAGAFTLVDSHAPGPRTQDAALVDLDGDGDFDLVCARTADDASVAYLLGRGDGTFDPPADVTLFGEPSERVTLTDVEGDGSAEILAVSTASSILSVLTTRLEAGFDVTIFEKLVDKSVNSFGVVDLDDDGFVDVIWVNHGQLEGYVRVEPGAPGSTFGPTQTVLDDLQAESALIGDLDRDGLQDVVVYSEKQGERLWTMLNDGDGTYTLAEGAVAIPGSVTTPLLADVNGDGRLDRLASTVNGLMALLGGPDGKTAGLVTSPIGFNEVASVGDVNGDGIVDVVSAYAQFTDGPIWFGGGIGLHAARGLGGGEFEKLVFLPSALGGPVPFPFDLVRIELADFDLDGDLDAAVLGGVVELFENDGNGMFERSDLAVPSAVSFSDATLMDVDHDGIPEVVGRWKDVGGGFAVLPVRDDLTFGQVRGSGPPVPQGWLDVTDIDGSGALDLATVAWTSGDVAFWTSRETSPRWLDRGRALPGAHATLRLGGTGDLTAGSPGRFAISQGMPGETVFLVVGASELFAPLKGGLLVPSPDVVLPLPFGAVGAAVLPFTWPAGVPSGVQISAQVWAADASAIAGFTASNGLRLTVP